MVVSVDFIIKIIAGLFRSLAGDEPSGLKCMGKPAIEANECYNLFKPDRWDKCEVITRLQQEVVDQFQS